MKKYILPLLTVLLPMVAFADAVEIDGIYYNLMEDIKEAEVTFNPNMYSGSVDIPATVNYDGVDYSVTSIAEWAFKSSIELTSVTIPNSVSLIRQGSFWYCPNLTSVTIPNSVTSIEYGAFYNCGSLTSIAIPNSVTSIGVSVFEECTSLTTITMPNNVEKIGDRAFSRCRITSIDLGNCVKSIGSYAFNECASLTSITIPNSVTTIGESAFNFCLGLTSVNIPDSLTTIEPNTFLFCYNLTSITIPGGVTSIGEGAFGLCLTLLDVYCYAENVPSTHSDAFNRSPNDYATLHVPAGSVDAYKAAVPWNTFKDIVPLDGQSIETLEYTSPSDRIDIYSIDGKFIGSATTPSEATDITKHLSSGTTVIIRMGGKSVKVVVK